MENTEWEYQVRFRELVRVMVDADLELAGLPSPGEGRRILRKRFDGWHRWEDQVISMEGQTYEHKILA